MRSTSAFQRQILAFYHAHGRHDLPWRKTHDPYRILVSEVMLQQTQVSRVIPKYREFLSAFPTIRALERAPLSKVLALWSGLGYNRRALNLKRLSDKVTRDYARKIPRDPEVLKSLPGIGPATAGAISAFAFEKRVPFIETNIRRVYLHFYFPSQKNVHDREILAKIQATLPRANIRTWYYALMDYGALALKSIENPNRRSRHYARQSKFEGSHRELRGKIIRELAVEGPLSRRVLQNRVRKNLAHELGPREIFQKILQGLSREGLINTRNNTISIFSH